MLFRYVTFLGYFFTFATVAFSQTNFVEISVINSERCIISNGTPNHEIGSFPNKGNPNKFRAQKIKICVDAVPKKKGSLTWNTNGSGIAITGIILRPGTADYFDETSRRGFSRNPASGWNLEGLGPGNSLGVDHENGHVDHRGLYHYHGLAASLRDSLTSSLFGFAADGFEIHYIGSSVKSSWKLRKGTRPTNPYGAYDGKFNEDYEFIRGIGDLDECNGKIWNGRYVYFATETYPFFPRCFLGRVSADFAPRR